MIEKILERLEEEALQAEKDMGLSDTFAEAERCGGRWAAYEKAYKIVQEVAKDGGWIPCSERLPEMQGNYYVTRKNGDVDIAGFLVWANGGFLTVMTIWTNSQTEKLSHGCRYHQSMNQRMHHIRRESRAWRD